MEAEVAALRAQVAALNKELGLQLPAPSAAAVRGGGGLRVSVGAGAGGGRSRSHSASRDVPLECPPSPQSPSQVGAALFNVEGDEERRERDARSTW